MRFPLIIVVLVLAGLSYSCANNLPAQKTQQSETTELTEAQAIEFAETFIERNGYTDLPADKENLAYESLEWESNVDEMLRLRQNSLESKAFGVSTGRKGNHLGWTVVFRYKKPSDRLMRKNGRAVTMNLDGSEVRVEHVDFILAKVGRKL